MGGTTPTGTLSFNTPASDTPWLPMASTPQCFQLMVLSHFSHLSPFYFVSKFGTLIFAEDVALFWGNSLYNTVLLQADEYELGSVTTDILLQKDAHSFTLSNGWAFPRRIYFNGENCQMPLPDSFPALPNGGPGPTPLHRGMLLLMTLVYLTCTMFVGC